MSAAPPAEQRNDGSLSRDLFLWFLALALIPLLAVSAVSLYVSRESLTKEAGKALTTAAVLKRSELQSYFHNRARDLILQSDLKNNVALLEELRQALAESGDEPASFVRGYTHARIAARHLTDLERFARLSDYYDILLLDDTGNILFTLRNESDLGTNLFTGPLRDTLFADAARTALAHGSVIFSDLERYAPSADRLALFGAHVMVNEQGEKIGVMAMQLPYNRLDAIMANLTGLGESGQTYLVGPDQRLRSRTRDGDRDDVLTRILETEAVRHWRQRHLLHHAATAEPETGPDGSHNEEKHLHVALGPANQPVVGIHIPLTGLERIGLHWAMVAEIETHEAYAPTRELMRFVSGLLFVTVLVVIFAAYGVTRRVVGPILALTHWARRLADGDLEITAVAAPRNEIGRLNQSFSRLATSLRRLSGSCRSIAVGEFDQPVKVRGKHDVLALSIQQIRDNFRGVVAKAQEVVRGEYLEMEPWSERDELGNSLARMTRSLRELTHVREEQRWLRDGEAAVSETLHGLQTPEELAERIIDELRRRLEADTGAFFLVDGEGRMRLASRFPPEADTTTSPLPDYPLFHGAETTIGEGSAKHRVVTGMLFEGRVLGVIELTREEGFSERQLQLLRNIQGMVGIGLNTVQSYVATKELLARTQSQAEELEQANRYKSEFLANMSHELRTPMHAILSYAAMGEQKLDDAPREKIERYFARIHTSGERLLFLLNDLLDLAKLEAGRMEFHFEPCNLVELAEIAIGELARLADEKRIAMRVEGAEEASARCDTDRTLQVLRNLIGNAIKFSPEGSPIRVRIAPAQPTDPTTRPGNKAVPALRITVEDRGVGIPEEEITTIFDKFVQSSKTKTGAGGTGLGLAISKEIIEGHGGAIWAANNTEGGVSFIFTLPVEQPATESEAPPPE